jgi:hypothetical protein
MCTDELAVEATGERMTYAATLELLGRKRLNLARPRFGMAVRGGKMALLNRVRNILDISPSHERARWWPVGLLALLVPLAIWSASTGVARPDTGKARAEGGEASESGSASKVGFDAVSVSFSDPMARQAPEHITINADGSCVYRIEGVPARGRAEGRPPARLTCQIDDKRLQQLNGLLEKTAWLAVPAGDFPAPPGAGEIEITVLRKGQTLSITCRHPPPEPYRSLIWFLRGVAHQENLLYRLRWGSLEQRLRAGNEIRSATEALEGKWGRGFPLYDVDYSRYLPTFREVVREPANRHPEEVAAAVRLVAFLRAESEFEPIAKMAHHSDFNVREQAARALADFGGERAVPVLAGMAAKSEEAIWGLIRLGDIAVPAIVEMIQKTNSYHDQVLSKRVVRVYMEHWNELPRPVDERVVAAAHKAAPEPKPYAFGEYHGAFLELIESRPVPAGDLLCRIDRQTVFCPKPVRFIHGWYTVADGEIVEHHAAPAPPPGTKVFGLKFEVATDGGRPVIRTGWAPARGPAGEQPQPVVTETVIDAPEGTHLDIDYRYYRDKPKMASSFSPFRVTREYRTLWEGRLVKDGQTLKRIVYTARVAGPDDPSGEFKPPSAPALSMAAPKRPPRQVTFRGMDLTNAPKVSDPAVMVDLEKARHNDAVRAEGGKPRYRAQAKVIHKSPFKQAPSRRFVIFHYPQQRVFYVLVEFREVGKRVESVSYGPFRGDPFEMLDLPVPPGEPKAGAEKKRELGAEAGEQDAVAALQKRGARVERDAAGMVTTVSFSTTRATDADLLHLKALTNLRRLVLHSASEDYPGFNQVDVTGAGLAHLGGLANLEELNLLGTTDTDAGLAYLESLSKLRSLNLGYTKVTDAGLAHLTKLTGLESLSLEAAHEITDAGLLHLQGLAELKHLHLDYTNIGDVGLKHLEPLAGLRSLHLYGAKVTDAGVKYLAKMRALRVLQVRRTRITTTGLKQLREALPNAEILADSDRPVTAPTKESEP